jgi:alpha-galactosidase
MSEVAVQKPIAVVLADVEGNGVAPENVRQASSQNVSRSRVILLSQPGSDVSVCLAVVGNDLPRFVHWGKALTASTASEMTAALDLATLQKPQCVSGAMEETAWPSILPTQSEAWTGSRRLRLSRDGIELFPKFAVTKVTAQSVPEPDGTIAGATEENEGSSLLAGSAYARVQAEDSEAGVGLEWVIELTAQGLVRQQIRVSNASNKNYASISSNTGGTARSDGAGSVSNVRPQHTSAAESSALSVGHVELGFPVPTRATEVLSTTGHHLRERSPQRQPLTVGRFGRESLVGRPDFDASLLLSAGTPGFGFESGEVWSAHVGWSGNSVLSVEKIPSSQPLIGGGELLFDGEVTLGKGESYTSPWVYGSYGTGLNEVAGRFHEFVRARHPRLRTKPRPVLLNTWEAVYFDQSYETLTQLADKAAEQGVERFVVDDGWFTGRHDDSAGLGDWQIDPQTWPQGLKPLADYVHHLGMEFGLWFEPEMINPDSNLARLHPDWILKPQLNRLPVSGRHQQVLDLTNPEAYAYICDSMTSLIKDLGIDYIKWDHNRFVTEAVSPRTGLPAVHAQTEAVYRLFEQLKASREGLEIESCSSGGGRIDLGILEHADRVWVSDCVDPVERVDIQRYTSLLVPPEMMGCHIGASPAHSTVRATSLPMRAATAFFGHLGVEWNLLKVSDDSLQTLGEWIREYKLNRELFASGRLVHADSGDPAVRLDGVIAADRSRAVFRFTQLTTSVNYPAGLVALPGLDAAATYRIRPLPVSENLGNLTNAQSELGWWNHEGTSIPGAVAASLGVRMPQLNPAQAILFEVERMGGK